jgi:tRNA dimethylallyltransferase
MSAAAIEDGKLPGKAETNERLTGRVLVLAGPTASGKSALAVTLARELGGTIINADSMQVYRDLPILTAQPDAAQQSAVPHLLYGYLALDDPGNAECWAALAASAIAAVQAVGRLPILVGGTGLYLRALMQGLSPIPDIPPEIRAEARALLAEIGPEELHRRLAERDPETALRLKPRDRQRLARAWEVLAASGRSITWWQAQPTRPPTRQRFLSFVSMPERESLYAACDRRFLALMEAGAEAEIAAALARYSSSALDAGGGRALGFAELCAFLQGRTSRAVAVAAAQQSTRNYAKRQVTWFRRQLPEANFISPDMQNMKFSQSYLTKIYPKIRDFLLTP